MAPPSLTKSFGLVSAEKLRSVTASLVFPTTTPSPFTNIFKNVAKKDDNARITTTIENDVTCGWYSGTPSEAFECSSSLSCATNKNNVIACTQKGDLNAFYSVCIDMVNATESDCSDSAVLCCNSPNPSCMTLLWTASPTRSLVSCNIHHSTWVMLDYPNELDRPGTTSASEESTSTSSSNAHRTTASSSKSTPSSDASHPPGTTSTLSRDDGDDDVSTTAIISPLNPSSPSDSDTSFPASSFGLSTYTVTTPTASNIASLLPMNPTPPVLDNNSGSLSTGAKAGIGVGASAGLLIILSFIAVFLFKKHQVRASTQPKQAQNVIGGPLQDNPSGDLPADIAPPARIARSPSTGWASNRSQDFDIAEGASEVPVDMRGQVVGAVELPGSPVETAPIGVEQHQYDEYQTQASQYRRYSSITRDSHGPVAYRSPPRENGAWPGSSF